MQLLTTGTNRGTYFHHEVKQKKNINETYQEVNGAVGDLAN
jgi:hypothetical protein